MVPLAVRFIRAVDAINSLIGRTVAWLILAAVLLAAANALLRYGFNIGFIWMQEAYILCFGAGFMLIAGYAYQRDQHVRVDIYHGRLNPRQKAWIEIVGIVVFLMPWLVTVAVFGASFILSSWRIREASGQPGGLSGIYLYKTVIWAFCLLLGLQALAVLARSALVLSGRGDLVGPPESHDRGHDRPAVAEAAPPL